MTLETPDIQEFDRCSPSDPDLYFKYQDEEYLLDVKYRGRVKVEITESDTSERVYSTWARGTYSNREKAEEVLEDVFGEFVNELDGQMYVEGEEISYEGPELPETPTRLE